MPEGDAVWRAAARLHAALAGRVLTRTDLRWPSLATTDLTGSTTVEVVARGKHLLHRIEGRSGAVTLHSHLRMEGTWRVAALGAIGTGGHDVRAVLETPDTVAVGRRLGMLDLVRTSDEHLIVGHLGPDLLGLDWDPDRAVANLGQANVALAAALLDQRNLAGLGTIWTSEALFLQRLNPWAVPGELTEEAVRELVTRCHRLITAGRLHEAMSSTGSLVPGSTTYVHGRSGLPCRRCGELVRVQRAGPATQERTIFFCPHCQGEAPGDDGRRQAPLGAGRRDGRARRTG